MKKYKVAFLTSHPIQYQAPLFKKLSEDSRIEPVVYFLSRKGLKKTYDPGFGREIKWDIPLLEGYDYVFLKGNTLQKLKRLFQGLCKNNFEGLVLHGYTSFYNYCALLCGIITGTPVFLRTETPLNQEKKKKGVKTLLKRIFLTFVFRFFSGFLYIGEENKMFYQSYGISDDKLYFVPYAVDNDRFVKNFRKLEGEENKIKKEIGISPQNIAILFVGKLISKKNPVDLIKAYEKLNFKDKVLVFVGSGQLEEKLKDYVKKRNIRGVKFMEFKNQTELPKYYAMADIFVLPSGMGETWGLVVNEAMCFKLPIIVSDLVGCGNDLVKNGENGYIFPVGDIDKLRFYLEGLIKNQEKREKFGKRSFEIVQNYSYKKDIEGILEALENIKV